MPAGIQIRLLPRLADKCLCLCLCQLTSFARSEVVLRKKSSAEAASAVTYSTATDRLRPVLADFAEMVAL